MYPRWVESSSARAQVVREGGCPKKLFHHFRDFPFRRRFFFQRSNTTKETATVTLPGRGSLGELWIPPLCPRSVVCLFVCWLVRCLLKAIEILAEILDLNFAKLLSIFQNFAAPILCIFDCLQAIFDEHRVSKMAL